MHHNSQQTSKKLLIQLSLHKLPPIINLNPLHALALRLGLGLRLVRQAHLPPVDAVAHLPPAVTTRRHGRDPAQHPVDGRGDAEPAEEVEVVDVRRGGGHVAADGAGEADDVDEDARDVGGVGAPVDAEAEVVRAGRPRVVQRPDLEVPPADEVVVGAHDAGDGGEEDGVGGEVRRELVRGGEQRVGAHGEADGGADVAAAADGQEAREQRGEVGARGDGVGGDVGAELGEGEGEGDDEDAEALAGPAVVDELFQQVGRVPDRVAAVDDGRAGRHDDADEAGDGEAEGDGEQLGPQGVAGLPGEAGEVRVVDDQGGEVGDGAHDALDELPGQGGPAQGGGLADDGADAARPHDGPDEEGDGRDGDEVGLDGEEVADLVDREPERWQADDPEDEETDPVRGRRAGVGRERVGDGITVLCVCL